MKTLFASVAVLLFAFFIGCQDTITDPVVSSIETNVGKDIIHAYPGVLKFNESILDPGHDNFVFVRGTLRYELKHVYTKQRPPKVALSVGLLINGEVRNMTEEQNDRWIVTGSSQDIVYSSSYEPEVYYLEKSFKVQNTSPAMDLVLKIRIEGKKLNITSMSLFVNEY